ncbi:hypothetical protein ABW19_dt0210537 [Dactylella cylindrospora]|nr:hypothetical protein ABW19_dt0210537 [Dactylella cylindrospora]
MVQTKKVFFILLLLAGVLDAIPSGKPSKTPPEDGQAGEEYGMEVFSEFDSSRDPPPGYTEANNKPDGEKEVEDLILIGEHKWSTQNINFDVIDPYKLDFGQDGRLLDDSEINYSYEGLDADARTVLPPDMAMELGLIRKFAGRRHEEYDDYEHFLIPEANSPKSLPVYLSMKEGAMIIRFDHPDNPDLSPVRYSSGQPIHEILSKIWFDKSENTDDSQELRLLVWRNPREETAMVIEDVFTSVAKIEEEDGSRLADNELGENRGLTTSSNDDIDWIRLSPYRMDFEDNVIAIPWCQSLFATKEWETVRGMTESHPWLFKGQKPMLVHLIRVRQPKPRYVLAFEMDQPSYIREKEEHEKGALEQANSAEPVGVHRLDHYKIIEGKTKRDVWERQRQRDGAPGDDPEFIKDSEMGIWGPMPLVHVPLPPALEQCESALFDSPPPRDYLPVSFIQAGTVPHNPRAQWDANLFISNSEPRIVVNCWDLRSTSEAWNLEREADAIARAWDGATVRSRRPLEIITFHRLTDQSLQYSKDMFATMKDEDFKPIELAVFNNAQDRFRSTNLKIAELSPDSTDIDNQSYFNVAGWLMYEGQVVTQMLKKYRKLFKDYEPKKIWLLDRFGYTIQLGPRDTAAEKAA